MFEMTTKFAWNGNDLKQAERRLFISDTSQTFGSLQVQREKGVAAVESVLSVHCCVRHSRIPASYG